MEQINSALNIMRRLPPAKVEFNVSGLLNLMPDQTDELLQRIDQPLKTGKDKKTGKLYLLCDYNRDGDSHRSPWSNVYDPPIPKGEGFMPPDWLRVIEEKANIVFDAYRNLYYEGGVSSAYLWDLSADGAGKPGSPFAGCFIIKKEIIEPQRRVSQGCWDSIHVIEVTPLGNKKAKYKLTTSVMLTISTEKGQAGAVNLSGSLTRQGKEQTLDAPSDDNHVINIGMIIEEMEIDVRNQLDGIYIQKTREVVNSLRKPFDAANGEIGSVATGAATGGLIGGLKDAVNARGGGGVALPGLGSKKP